MSNMNNDGGPAFPAPDGQSASGAGMSLRDYFAAKAMQQLLETTTIEWRKDIAADSYLMADAMLRAGQSLLNRQATRAERRIHPEGG